MESTVPIQSYSEQFATSDHERYSDCTDGRLSQENSMAQHGLTNGKPKLLPCDNRISKALATLRSELLDLKRQDTSLYTQLRSIDSHIQRLKSEIRVEEERKLQYSEDEEEDEEDEDEEIAYQLGSKKNGYYEDVLRKTMNYSDYDHMNDTAHERYDSGIQADEADYEECSRSRTSSNGSWKDVPHSHTYMDKGVHKDGVDSKQSRHEDKYTTFVLTTPTKLVTSSETLNRDSGKEDVYLRQPAVPVHKVLQRKGDIGYSNSGRQHNRTQSDEYIFSRENNHCNDNRASGLAYTAKTQNSEKTVPWQHEVNGRYFTRKQGAGKTMSLVNISESGELMFHDARKGVRTSSVSRKTEMEREVSRALDSFNRKSRPSSARASSKTNSNIDLRSAPSYRDACAARTSHGTASLTDLRPDLHRNSVERNSCGFALVPGQRNTLPVSKASISDTERKGRVQIKCGVLNQSQGAKHDIQSLKRTYSLSAKRPASMTNLSDSVNFYRSPSGENFQEHTLAYYNAARSFPRTVSVASLV